MDKKMAALIRLIVGMTLLNVTTVTAQGNISFTLESLNNGHLGTQARMDCVFAFDNMITIARSVHFFRKRQMDPRFAEIASAEINVNPTFRWNDTSLRDRSEFINLNRTHFRITVNNLNCEDKAEYRCRFLLQTQAADLQVNSDLKALEITAPPQVPKISYSPSFIVENEPVRLTCSGNVGLPVGSLSIYVVKPNDQEIDLNARQGLQEVEVNGCTFQRTAIASYNFTAEDNARSRIRCRVQQAYADPSLHVNTTDLLTVRYTTPVTRSTTSGVTTSGGTTAGRSDVVCGQEFIRTEIPAALLGQSAGEFRLEEPSCSFNVVGGKLVAQFGFNQCGTSVEFTEQAIVYRNFLTSVSTGEAVPIICEYPRRNSVSVSYQPVQRRVRLFERSLGTIDMAMRQYTSSDFQTEVPASDFPTVVKLQKPVYLQVEATSALGSSLTVFPISCSASASASVPVSETSHPLIQKGCKKDSGVIIYPAGNGKFQFSFNAFTFASQAQVVYIHCEVLFCNARDLASKCQTDCTAPETTRTKRSSTRAGQSGHYISGGPIMLDNQASGADSSLVAVLVAVAAVSMLVAVVAVVVAGVSIRMRRSKPGLDSQE